MRWVRWVTAGSLGLAALALLTQQFGWWEVRRLSGEVKRLEEEKQQLLEFARRLTSAQRIAQFEVTQRLEGGGHSPQTHLLWQEIGPDGTAGRPQRLAVSGELVYVEAAVLKFDYGSASDAATSARTSLALFRRVFGDRQQPADGAELDTGTLPVPDRGADPSTDTWDDQRLWEMFWQFVDNPVLAETYAIRVAQIEAPAVPLNAGNVWEVSLDHAGGINIRKLGRRRDSRLEGAPMPRGTSTSAG
ncbi:MAG: hypothetical protein HY763_08040 [Planctomycetes bacterium]|nr:hypothetical protein [Planctomycetota bacterium]